ncbi:3-keto-disaccharide hydrolase [Olivibacter domesticus]|uniref:3-keto-alpha-glucoside-1,2-lyase/3-keto-2-hydroxy-glucal hydratase domain-containing protein n=1 Tax=Olivibacter domesticus TaxID=407022 RepID=A0A1H7R1F1_OLID1|nr:DUF1080 domain-containing protein [Olivibacter domesticus]SEL53929.1 protein of unknown function [Olivibacter domesticus]
MTIQVNFFLSFVLVSALGLSSAAVHAQDNTLTGKEKTAGWQLLFNGKDLSGWTSPKGTPLDADWKVENGKLSLNETGTKTHIDMISVDEYSDFDLRVDFKLTNGANSGIKYFFTRYSEGGWLGMEYQLIDNDRHPDAKLGRNGNRQLSALYDMIPVTKKVAVKVGDWNHARIVAKGSKVTHYVNGQEVLSFDRKSPAFENARQLSKFNEAKPAFGSVNKGHILLQDHGDIVYFKNVKIKAL